MIDPYLEEDHECSGDSSCEDCFLAWKKRAATAQAEIVALRASLKTAQKDLAIASLAVPLEEDLSNRIDEMLKYLAMGDGFTLNGIGRLLVDVQRRMADDWLVIGRERLAVKTAQEKAAGQCDGCGGKWKLDAEGNPIGDAFCASCYRALEAQLKTAEQERDDLKVYADNKDAELKRAYLLDAELQSKLSTLLAARDRLIEQWNKDAANWQSSRNVADRIVGNIYATCAKLLSTLGEQA